MGGENMRNICLSVSCGNAKSETKGGEEVAEIKEIDGDGGR